MKNTPRGRREVKGKWSDPGISMGTNMKMIPPSANNPSQSVMLQKTTTFAISSVESPHAE
jgi:hypothetical protein